MVVVGSRCGGYDFYATGKCGIKLWLGAEKDSDIDVFSNERPPNLGYKTEWLNTQDFFIDRLINGQNIRGGTAKPYCLDGILHMPDDFKFLSFAIRKKLQKMGCLQKQFFKQKYKITHQNNKFCCNINLSFVY